MSAVSAGKSRLVSDIASATGVILFEKSSIKFCEITSSGDKGVHFGPSPVMKCTFRFNAHGTIKISEKIIAASKPKRLIGCNVTSLALSGVKQKEIKSGVVALTSRYSFK